MADVELAGAACSVRGRSLAPPRSSGRRRWSPTAYAVAGTGARIAGTAVSCASAAKVRSLSPDNTSWDWPDELDALVAAPENHRVLLENDRVRVIQTQVPAGATTRVHTHRWASVEYVLSTTDFIRRDGDGDVVLDTRTAHARPRPSDVLWSGPRPPHSIENVGDTELRVLMVELKDRTPIA